MTFEDLSPGENFIEAEEEILTSCEVIMLKKLGLHDPKLKLRLTDERGETILLSQLAISTEHGIVFLIPDDTKVIKIIT